MKTSFESAKEITIVIITFNRYNFLKRLLKFYDNYNEKFNFLILDSSSKELEKSLSDYIKRNNVQYYRFDSNIFFIKKLAEGSKYIKTKYAVCCADDDFLIPYGILKSKEYLDKNPNYSSAQGLYFNHLSYNKINILRRFSLSPIYSGGRSSEEESASERIIAYLEGLTYPSLYAVYRTKLFQEIWSETNKYVSDWSFSELFPCALSYAHGKMKVLPVFYSSREPNSYRWFSKQRFLKLYSTSKINKFTEGLSKHIQLIDKVSADSAIKSINDAIQNNLNFSLLKLSKLSNLPKNSQKNLFVRIKSNLALRTSFRSLLRFNPLKKELYKDYTFVKKAVIDSGDLEKEMNNTRQEY